MIDCVDVAAVVAISVGCVEFLALVVYLAYLETKGL